MTWKQLTENDCHEWKLNVRATIHAASQLAAGNVAQICFRSFLIPRIFCLKLAYIFMVDIMEFNT